MNKHIILLSGLLSAFATHAEIKLPDLISDNMVVQQEADACLWGEAKAGSTVSIRPSWTTQVFTTKAGSDGRWTTTVATPSASFTPYTLTIADDDGERTLHNVLVGEVWFCSGQSNMEMPLNGFWNCPIDDANNLIADAPNHPAIRMATIERRGATTPQEYARGQWKLPTPDNAQWFSATAYHYALALQRTLQVPVGIISCAWGGSRVEGWLPKEILETYPDEDLSKAGSKEGTEYLQPMIMYNGLLYPSHRYTIRGFAWYQGCSNVGHADTYAERLATMVEHWRKLWNNPDLPFYFVEIAPFAYDGDANGVNGALLREAQFDAQALIPNSAMICTNDLVKPYEAPQIHPANKRQVGERLAYQALNKTYGYKAIVADSPSYESMEVKGDTIEVSFRNASEGFSPWNDIVGFEVAGADGKFYPAEAWLDTGRMRVCVRSEKVSSPVAVRYGFRNFLPGNLKNHRGLPLIPFRSDR